VTITGNEVYNNGTQDGSFDADFEISIVNAVNPVTITRNYVHDSAQGAIQVVGSGSNSVISYNVIKDFGSDTSVVSKGKHSGVRIGSQDGLQTTGILVYNNTITNGGSSAYASGFISCLISWKQRV